MCCSGKPKSKAGPQSQIQKSEIQQSQIKPPQESQQVQPKHDPKPEEVRAVDLMESKLPETEESKQKKHFQDLTKTFKGKYLKLKEDAENHQFNQNPVDQVRLDFQKEQLTVLTFPNNEIKGPIFLDDRVSKFKERGVAFANTLREIQDNISQIRLVRETPYNSFSYIGYIKEKGQYFVKCWNGVDVNKFQTFLLNIAKTEQQRLEHYKKYHAYKIEKIHYTEEQVNIGNIHLVSTLEDHNLLTFAASNRFTFEQKLGVAKKIIQYLYQSPNDSQIKSGINQDPQSKLKFVAPTNILISESKSAIDVKIADWQQSLTEFTQINPQISQSVQVYGPCSDDKDNQAIHIKKLLILLFFRLNFSQQQTFGNLDGLEALGGFIEVKEVTTDSKFIQQQGFNRYIISKINLISQNQEKYREMWEEIKDKSLDNLKKSLNQSGQ